MYRFLSFLDSHLKEIKKMVDQVIVVGAGLSGLSAAKWLNESGVNVLVLEARDRVGGRTLTEFNSKVDYVDIGAAYIGPGQNRFLRMAKEFGVENYKVNEKEKMLFYKNGKRTPYEATSFPISNPFVLMDINNIFYLVDKMTEEIPAEAPWNAPHAEAWDKISFKEWLHKTCWTKGAIEFFNNLNTVVLTAENYEASLLGFIWVIKLGGGCKRVFSITNGAQERKVIGGTQQISKKMAKKLGDSVIMESPVISIDQTSKDAVIVKTLNGKEYKAKYVILALPPILQMKIHFAPKLSALRNQLIQRAPMGSIMKSILYYSEPFWRSKGLCGAFLIDGGKDCPINFTLDDTKPDGRFPAIVGFVAADKLRKFCQLSVEERKNIVAQKLAEVSGLQEFLQPIHYEEYNWMDEQYSGGGYSAVYRPGFFTGYGKVIREPIDRMYFAGTETAVEWSGYMEGAIEAGERSAREILYAMGKITQDKIFQREPESTDIIAKPFEVSFAERYTPSVPTFLKLMALFTAGIGVFAAMNYPAIANCDITSYFKVE
ncbi:amine oxidase [flavin-containing]-like [Parasteatoda tepidariorum]